MMIIKRAFVTPFHQYEFTRMPFGLQGHLQLSNTTGRTNISGKRMLGPKNQCSDIKCLLHVSFSWIIAVLSGLIA